MHRGTVRAAIESLIDDNDNRDDLVVALLALAEAVWYEGEGAGRNGAIRDRQNGW